MRRRHHHHRSFQASAAAAVGASRISLHFPQRIIHAARQQASLIEALAASSLLMLADMISSNAATPPGALLISARIRTLSSAL